MTITKNFEKDLYKIMKRKHHLKKIISQNSSSTFLEVKTPVKRERRGTISNFGYLTPNIERKTNEF